MKKLRILVAKFLFWLAGKVHPRPYVIMAFPSGPVPIELQS